MPDTQPDVVLVTLLVGAGMNDLPVTEDLGAFQRHIARAAASTPSDALGLNLIFELPAADASQVKPSPRVTRFDTRRNRITIVAGVPRDLSPAMTTRFLNDQVSAVKITLEGYIARRRIDADLQGTIQVLSSATALLPSQPLPEDERYREILYREEFPGSPERTYVELDGAGEELRKVDLYSDGRMDYAVRSIATGATRLNASIPTYGEARSSSRSSFLGVWEKAIGQERPRGQVVVLEDETTDG